MASAVWHFGMICKSDSIFGYVAVFAGCWSACWLDREVMGIDIEEKMVVVEAMSCVTTIHHTVTAGFL